MGLNFNVKSVLFFGVGTHTTFIYDMYYIGNLNRKITEKQLSNAIEGITHIKWITDKLTQEFYGSTFVEMRDPQAAVNAVMMDKQKLMGR